MARRDGIALAYISQLILTTQTAMAREEVAGKEAESRSFAHRLLQRSGKLSSNPSSGEPRFAESTAKAGVDAPRRTAYNSKRAPRIAPSKRIE